MFALTILRSVVIAAGDTWLQPKIFIGGGASNKQVSVFTVYTVAIGNPERHMRKASRCGSKQQ